MSGRQRSGVGYRVTYKAVLSIALIAVGTAVAQTGPSASYNEYLRSQYGTQYVPGTEAQVVPQPAPQAVPQQVPQQVPQAPSQAAPQAASQSAPQAAPSPAPQMPAQVAPQSEAVNPYGPAPVPQAQAQSQQPAVQTVAAMTAAQLDTLVGPVALYPDPLLALVFAASTAPADVLAADGLLRARGGVVIEAEIDAQPWSQAVKSLAREPGLVAWMASQRQWMDALGWAVTYQSQDVMATVQRLRFVARANGSLVDTPQQRIAYADGGAIVILPVQPEVVYVPVYEPAVVFVPTPVVYPQPVRFRPAFRPGPCPEVDWGRGRFSFEIGVSRGYGHPYSERGHGGRFYNDPYRPSPSPRWDDRDRGGRDRDDRYIPGRGDRESDARTEGDSRGRGTVTLPPGSRRIDERPSPRDERPAPRDERPRPDPRDDDRRGEPRQEPRAERPTNPSGPPRTPTPLPGTGSDDARRARDDERARNRGTSAGAPPAPTRIDPRGDDRRIERPSAPTPPPPAPRPVEPPRQERLRQEPPRSELPRTEAPRPTPAPEARPQERERRRGTESPGGSNPPAAAPRPSAPAAPRQEAPRQEAPRQESPRQESPRQEPSRQDPPRQSAPPPARREAPPASPSDRQAERDRNRGTTSDRR